MKRGAAGKGTGIHILGRSRSVPWELLSMPLIGALIGWLTNRIAVLMLFRPRRPWQIPLLGITIHGVLPRRHSDLARIIGETVERELLSAETLVRVLEAGHYREHIVSSVEAHLRSQLGTALSRYVPAGLLQPVLNPVIHWMCGEAERLWEDLQASLVTRIREDVSIAQLVEARILSLDVDQLERLVMQVSSRELRFIEVIGGVLGFVIGVVQAAFLLVAGSAP